MSGGARVDCTIHFGVILMLLFLITLAGAVDSVANESEDENK